MPITKNNNPRMLLAKSRNGDYVHAGETEAIDLVLNKIKEIQIHGNKVLDVGCGLGGTAEYIRKKINCEMVGVDIDESSLEYARKKYPEIKFFHCDAQQLTEEISKEKFDFIYMFNVFYAFQNQKKSLEELSKISKPDTLLVIFDYTQANRNSIERWDFSGKQMNPVYIKDLLAWLEETGWSLIEVVDISAQYKMWYEDFLDKFEKNKTELLEEFTKEAVDIVERNFSFLLENIEAGKMGGAIIYAKRKLS